MPCSSGPAKNSGKIVIRSNRIAFQSNQATKGLSWPVTNPAALLAAVLRSGGHRRRSPCKYLRLAEPTIPRSQCPAPAKAYLVALHRENTRRALSPAPPAPPKVNTAKTQPQQARQLTQTPSIQSSPSQNIFPTESPHAGRTESAHPARAISPRH